MAAGLVVGSNLPRPLFELVGREDDIAIVLADLASARVVTLTGVGGIGKTTLAVGVAGRVDAGLADVVLWARLDTCVSGADVLGTLLAACGIQRRQGSRAELDVLVAGLRSRRAILVIDSCEHVVATVARVVGAVVERCPEVRVLATSREPLAVAGERVRRVQTLDASNGGAAAALFIARALDVGCRLDMDRDHAVVGEICRRLEGIPLAIELAAARCRSLRPGDILERLDDMAAVLASGPRDAPDRHRTMYAALAWSYELLAPEERAALARASVFVGPFDIDAFDAVCAGGASRSSLDVLDRLVTRSLLTPVHEEHSRFRLLEPVRQFAREQLAATGDEQLVRDRHTAWYRDLMSRLGATWRAGDDQTAWQSAASNLADLRTAFERLLEARSIDDAERFVVDAFGPIAVHIDAVPERDWAPRALGLDPDHVGPATASCCGVAAWGATDPTGAVAAALIRRGEAAVGRGSLDDGLLTAAAMHQLLLGRALPIAPSFVDASVAAAVASEDLHRQVWVLAYTHRGKEALAAAERLGHRMLISLARLSIARDSTGQQAIEAFWLAAQSTHCAIMLNHAAQMLGDVRIREGSALEGLMMLRSAVGDWYLDGDQRVWDVLHSVATGLVTMGDAVGAARLLGAVGQRELPFVREERARAESLVASVLTTNVRVAHERDGRQLDLGAAVEEALARIDAAARPQDPAGDGILTRRQMEVAVLVAQGRTNKEIAQQLAVSRFTVETHVRNILERLGAANRSQVATWVATRRGQRPAVTACT